MADIKKIKIGSTTYNLRDSRVITLVDSGSTTAGTWVASTDSPTQNLTEYADGQLFLYKVAVAGASTTTLNIDSLGAKTVYRGSSSKLATHYGVGAYVLLYYSAALNSGCFMVVNDYATDNDKKTASANTSNKIYLIGATSQSSSGQTTYSHDTVYVGTDGHLYCNGKQVSHVGHTHEITVANAAPQGHTHTVTVNGTTGANSGTAVTALTGVKVSSSSSAAPGGHKHNYDKTTGISLTANTSTATDRIKYVESISGSKPTLGGTTTFVTGVTEGSGHLEAYDAATDGNKTTNDGARIKYVESITAGSASGTGAGSAAPQGHTHTYTTYSLSGSNSSHTPRYMKVTTTAASKASVGISGGSGSLTSDTTSTNGTLYVESISNTAASASGTAKAGSETHTHSYTKPTGVSLGSNTTASGGVKYIEDVTHTAASLTGTTSFNTDAIKSVTLSASDTSTDGPEYVQSVTHTAASLTGTKTFNTDAIKSVTLSESTTSTDGPQYIKSVSGGSGSLASYDAATGGNVKTANGTRIPYIHDVTHTPASLTGTTNFVTGLNLGSGSLTSDTTSTDGIPYIASASHTAASLGTASTSSAAPGGHKHSYDKTTSVTLAGNTETATGRVKYTEDISGSKPTLEGATTFVTSVSGGSGHLKSYNASTNGTAITSSGRIQYIHSLSKDGYTPAGSVTLTSGTAPSMSFNTGVSTDTPYIASLDKAGYTPAGSVSLTAGTAPSMGSATTKYLSASASGTAVGANGTGSVAPSGHTHTVTVSGTTGDNSGTAVTAITGYPNFSGGSLTGTKTFVTGYSSFSGGSLTGTKTFNTDAIKSIGGTRNYGFSSSTSNVMHSPTVTNGVLSWSTTSASTRDAHTGTAASTGTVGFTAASLGTASTGTVGFTAASLGTPTTGSAAPHTHTHSYGSSTALTTGGNSGTAITALTGVKVTAQPTITLTANTSTATGRIKYVEAQGSFSAGTTPPASASFTGTNSTAVVTGGTTKYMKFTAGTTPKTSASFSGTKSTAVVTGGTTYYLDHAHTGASAGGSGTVTISGGEYTAGIKYMSATPSTTSTNTGSNSGTNFNAVTGYPNFSGGSGSHTTKYLHHTHTPSEVSGTGTVGISGGSISKTTYYLAHGHTAASGTTRYMKATGTAASTGTVGISGGSVNPVTQYMKVNTEAASTGTVGISGGSINKTTKYFHPSVTTESANTGTPSATTSFVTGVTGGTTTATSKYLHHTHNAASLTGTTSFNTDAIKAVSLSASTTSTDGPAYVASATNSSLSLTPTANGGTTSTNSGTAVSTISGVSYTAPTADTRYLDHEHIPSTEEGTGTVTISNGSYSATTKYLSATPTNTATETTENSGTNFNAATAVAANGTASVAPSEHTHSYGSSTALTTTGNSGTAVAAVVEVAPSTD